MSMRDLIHWDRPFNGSVKSRGNGLGQSLFSLQEEMNRLFEDFFNGGGESEGESSGGQSKGLKAMPAVDIIENEKSYKIKAELPGIDPDKVDIEMSDGLMTIKGERQEEKEEKGENYVSREMSYGSFHRSVSLPSVADSDKAEASFKNGVLIINVPKKAEALKKPKKLQVKKAA